MSKIKSKDTSIEVKLRKALWRKGYRYRKNYKQLPGSPDIVLTKYHIAIFCDSEFFHGKNYQQLHQQLEKTNNSQFWIEKIERNIVRDQQDDRLLNGLGWRVLHFWGEDINENLDGCIEAIEEAIMEMKVESLR